MSLTQAYEHRFGGIQRVLGQQGLVSLSRSHVMVIGLGGVGSWAVEALARTGVGEITIVDFDDICLSNTNRQIHTLQSTVGKQKTHILKNRIEEINPECKVQIIEEMVGFDNIEAILGAGPDFVIDAVDSMNAKLAIILQCKKQQIPLVVSGGAGGRGDFFSIKRADLAKTKRDPLLYGLRKKLRKEFNFPRGEKSKFAIEAVYSEEPLKYPSADGEVCLSKEDDSVTGLDCASGLGSLSFVTAAVGMALAQIAMESLIQAQS